VWLEALRYVCDTHGLFRPSFPLADMSQKALEHAALFPYVFSSGLLSKQGQVIQPFVTRLLEPRMMAWNTGEENREVFEDFRLIPGGRFLITKGTNRIHLWDLRVNTLGFMRPFPLASMPSDGNAIIVNVHPTPNGLGIRLCVATVVNSFISGLSVHVVYPLPVSPCQFELMVILRNVNVPVAAWFSAYTQKCIAFCHNFRFLTVWNFELDSVVTWEVDNDNDQQTRDKLVLFDEYIIMSNSKAVSLYEIPPLTPCSEIEKPCHPEAFLENIGPRYYRAMFKFAHPSARQPRTEFVLPSRSWMPDHHRPLYFSIVAMDVNSRSIEYYVMQSLGNQLAPNLPKQIPVLMSASEVQCRLERFGPMGFCDKYLAQSWAGSNSVVLSLSEVSDTSLARGGPRDLTTVKLWASSKNSDRIRHFSFCPGSGKLCVMTMGDEIRIIDYLIPV